MTIDPGTQKIEPQGTLKSHDLFILTPLRIQGGIFRKENALFHGLTIQDY